MTVVIFTFSEEAGSSIPKLPPIGILDATFKWNLTHPDCDMTYHP